MLVPFLKFLLGREPEFFVVTDGFDAQTMILDISLTQN
jgi:hypothetical protein